MDSIFDKFIEIRPIVIEGEPEAHSVYLKVGVQSFCISPHGCDNKEHAEWLASMFEKALTNMFQECGTLSAPQVVGGELFKALQYMANRDNWYEEDGFFKMKRPGGGGQKGIMMISFDLAPWIFAQQALSASPVAGWIAVSERLPEENTPVMVYRIDSKAKDELGEINFDAVEDGVWIELSNWEDWASSVGKPENSYVPSPEITHWMPLPKPPQPSAAEEGEGE